ncbi:hypothetical protein ACOMHN_049789 [Nucella lapillus]
MTSTPLLNSQAQGRQGNSWRSGSSSGTGSDERSSSVDKSCIELKQLPRQSSTASSSDTYASCQTHPHSSPSTTAHTPSDKARHNLYVNPLGDPADSVQLVNTSAGRGLDAVGSYEQLFSDLPHDCGGDGLPVQEVSGPPAETQSPGPGPHTPTSQIVQMLNTGLSTTWQRGLPRPFPPSSIPPPLQAHPSLPHPHPQTHQPLQQSQSLNSHPGHHRTLQRQLSAQSDSNSTCVPPAVAAAAGPRRSSFKRHKSLSVEKHSRVTEVKERNYSSTDNLAGQGFQRPKLKFRKAVSLASRLQSSPSTGRKLANYHLITSTKSGSGSGVGTSGGSTGEERGEAWRQLQKHSPMQRSSPALFASPSFSPSKKRSLLRREPHVADDNDDSRELLLAACKEGECGHRHHSYSTTTTTPTTAASTTNTNTSSSNTQSFLNNNLTDTTSAVEDSGSSPDLFQDTDDNQNSRNHPHPHHPHQHQQQPSQTHHLRLSDTVKQPQLRSLLLQHPQSESPSPSQPSPARQFQPRLKPVQQQQQQQQRMSGRKSPHDPKSQSGTQQLLSKPRELVAVRQCSAPTPLYPADYRTVPATGPIQQQHSFPEWSPRPQHLLPLYPPPSSPPLSAAAAAAAASSSSPSYSASDDLRHPAAANSSLLMGSGGEEDRHHHPHPNGNMGGQPGEGWLEGHGLQAEAAAFLNNNNTTTAAATIATEDDMDSQGRSHTPDSPLRSEGDEEGEEEESMAEDDVLGEEGGGDGGELSDSLGANRVSRPAPPQPLLPRDLPGPLHPLPSPSRSTPPASTTTTPVKGQGGRDGSGGGEEEKGASTSAGERPLSEGATFQSVSDPPPPQPSSSTPHHHPLRHAEGPAHNPPAESQTPTPSPDPDLPRNESQTGEAVESSSSLEPPAGFGSSSSADAPHPLPGPLHAADEGGATEGGREARPSPRATSPDNLLYPDASG